MYALSLFVFFPALSEFSTHMRIKRTRKMFAHAPDRPVCHDGDSLHPSTRASLRSHSLSFSSLSHPSHLSSSASPSLLVLFSLFLSHTRARAGVAFLPSFSPLATVHPPLLSLTPASPLRLFARTQDEIVKPVLHYSNWRDSARAR